MATRSRREENAYKAHLKQEPTGCTFCTIKKGDKQFVEETRFFKIITNIFGYSVWDSQSVADHLMAVPKKHVDSLAALSDAAAVEFVKIISRYEAQGYSVYARTPGSPMKSVAHQHTHLIKTEGAPKNLLLTVRKPFYFRIPR